MKTTKRLRVGACSLVHNTSRVHGHVGALEWELGRMTNGSIVHMHMHKPNNKLVNAYLKHFWCTDEPWANMDSQDSRWPRLGGSHHLPVYSILCAWP